METEKRAVHTDALHTLGSVIGPGEKRDAIHLAVEPAVAAVTVYPGQHVGFVPGGFGPAKKNVGIVDPFISGAVLAGQTFWLIVYPRQITSLRHVWEHPDFDETKLPDDPATESRRWIEAFADTIDQTYSKLMAAAELWLESEYYTYDNSEAYKPHYAEFPEFWKHYVVVTGQDVPEDKRDTFFTCSC